jgi:GT2 family glycosyltransferase
MPPTALEVSVVIPIHTQKRWESLVTAVGAVQRQEPAPRRIVVCVDHNPDLLQRVRDELPAVHVTANHFAAGASGARNSGAEQVETPLIAFLDSDVRPRHNWLRELVAPFADSTVLGTGGFVAPVWLSGRPDWFPEEFLWVVGATFQPTTAPITTVRNVWSESMAVRRDAFWRVNGFRVDFGKVGDRSSPEDTDLCLRMSHAHRGQRWVLAANSVVDHTVGPERSTLTFFMRRCFQEGFAKVRLGRLHSGRAELSDEYAYMKRIVSTSLWTYLRSGVREPNLTDLRRGMAIVGGLSAAAAGAVTAWGTPRHSRR